MFFDDKKKLHEQVIKLEHRDSINRIKQLLNRSYRQK